MPPKDWIKRKKIGFRLIELKLDIFSVKCFDYRVSQSPNSWDWRHETFGLKILWKQLLLGLWMIVLHLPSEDELFWGGVQKQVVILYSIGRWKVDERVITPNFFFVVPIHIARASYLHFVFWSNTFMLDLLILVPEDTKCQLPSVHQ